MQHILLQIQQGFPIPNYEWVNQQLRRKGKLVVGLNSELRQKLLSWAHASPVAGHSGREATLHRIKSMFYWKGVNKDVFSFVRRCVVCQACKYDNAAYPGLLQLLQIPTEIWRDISMDFIEGLPRSMGKDVIFVVVDRMSKYAHLMTLAHPFLALEVAQSYLDYVFKLHGLPNSIVSDRDSVFLSNFWQALFSVHGVELNLSFSYHPQTDGQTEVLNRCLEAYLRCMSSQEPKVWCKWLPTAKWWYNTTYHSSIHMTPFEAVYGQPPPIHLSYLPGESSVATVDRSLLRREQILKMLKFSCNGP